MKNYLHDTIDILKYLLIGAVCGLGLNYVILHSPLPKIFPAYTDRISSAAFSVNIIYGILLYCIAAPIIEELVFRIFIYNTVYRFLGFLPAALISSLLFGAFHMNMIQFVYASIMGMLICVMYHSDHRTPVPMLIHCGANLAVWLSSAFL
jgi:membrane protease YdiL (CAAX protease family)